MRCVDVAAALTGNRLSISCNPVYGDLKPFQCHLTITALGSAVLVQQDPDAACEQINVARTRWTVEGPIQRYTVVDGSKYPYQPIVRTDRPLDICTFASTGAGAVERFVQAGVAIHLASWIRAHAFLARNK